MHKAFRNGGVPEWVSLSLEGRDPSTSIHSAIGPQLGYEDVVYGGAGGYSNIVCGEPWLVTTSFVL